MKKLSIVTALLLFVAVGAYLSYNKSEPAKVGTSKLADARLSMAQIERDIESKIGFILENVTKNGATPTSRELKSLVNSISVIRAYGKDISKKAKLDILKIVKKLADENFKDIKVLKELKNISITSQQLTA